MTTSYDVAGMFLRAISAPDTSGMRRAVAIWLRFETGNTIIGNNPWNLHSGAVCTAERRYCPGQGSLPGQIGNRYAGPGDRNVAVFGTLDAGVKASAQNILRTGYGYPAIVRAARRGDPIGFLTALQNSSWSAGHYGYRKLVNAMRSTLGYNTTLTFRTPQGGGDTGDVGTRPGTTGAPLTFWGVITFPTGHILTAADVDYIMTKLHSDTDIFDTDFTGLGATALRSLLTAFIGRQWNDQLALDIQRGAALGADQVKASLNPVKGITDVFSFLFDAQNWLYIFALLAGLALAASGGKLIIDATRTPLPTGEGTAA